MENKEEKNGSESRKEETLDQMRERIERQVKKSMQKSYNNHSSFAG